MEKCVMTEDFSGKRPSPAVLSRKAAPETGRKERKTAAPKAGTSGGGG